MNLSLSFALFGKFKAFILRPEVGKDLDFGFGQGNERSLGIGRPHLPQALDQFAHHGLRDHHALAREDP